MLPGLSCTKKSGGVKETKKNMECSELRAMESVRTIFNTRPVPVPRITQLVLGYGECSVRSVVSQGMRRNHCNPRATAGADRKRTNGATAAPISNGRTTPTCSAIHQQSNTAIMVSRIAVTEGTSFSMLSCVDQKHHGFWPDIGDALLCFSNFQRDVASMPIHVTAVNGARLDTRS